jgi:hypothetical protein
MQTDRYVCLPQYAFIVYTLWNKYTKECFNVLLTAHLTIALVNDQLEAHLLYFIIRSLQSSTCFEQHRAHHQEIKLY